MLNINYNLFVYQSGDKASGVDRLAVGVLHLTRGRIKEAKESIDLVKLPDITGPSQPLIDTLIDHWPLLLDNTKQVRNN